MFGRMKNLFTFAAAFDETFFKKMRKTLAMRAKKSYI